MTARIINLGDFLAGLRDEANDSEALAKTALRRIALGILTRVVMASPVDTGRFRGNWQVDIGSGSREPVERLDRGGGPTIAAGSLTVQSADLSTPVVIANNVDYAARLNAGWSRQAPAGFVEAAIDAELAPFGVRFP